MSTMPHDPDLEAAVIGQLVAGYLPDPRSLIRIMGDAPFLSPVWSEVWAVVRPMLEAGDAVDIVTVAAIVGQRRKEPTDRVLNRLVAAVTADPADHRDTLARAKLLRELALRRQLIAWGADTSRLAYQEPDVDGVLAYTLRVAEQMDDVRADEETGDLRDVIAEAEAAVDTSGLSTGLECWDEWRQLHPGDIHVIGGGSGVGKTWLCTQAAKAVALAGKAVALFTLEMSPRDVWWRLMANAIGPCAFKASRGRALEEHEMQRYNAAKASWHDAPLKVYHSQRSVARIAGIVRQTQPAVAVIDYFQLLEASGKPYEARAENARALQALAKRTGCAIIVATQMSRGVLREKGTLIQGAADTPALDQAADLWIYASPVESDRQAIQLQARKNRHGVTGGKARIWLQPTGGWTEGES